MCLKKNTKLSIISNKLSILSNSPTLRRVRFRVASLLSLRASEPPSRRLVGRPDPPDLRGVGPAR